MPVQPLAIYTRSLITSRCGKYLVLLGSIGSGLVLSFFTLRWILTDRLTDTWKTAVQNASILGHLIFLRTIIAHHR